MSTTEISTGLPSTEELREFVECLFGEYSLTKKTTEQIPTSKTVVYAPFLNGENAVAYYVLMDLELSNASGAALSLIPPSIVKEANQNGLISENTLDNAKEVINIILSLVTDSSQERVILGDIVVLKDTAEERTDSTEQTWEVEIPKYPAGKIAVGKKTG